MSAIEVAEVVLILRLPDGFRAPATAFRAMEALRVRLAEDGVKHAEVRVSGGLLLARPLRGARDELYAEEF